MTTIITRILKSGRIRATASNWSFVAQWDPSITVSANHLRAAQALAARMGVDGVWHQGTLPQPTQ